MRDETQRDLLARLRAQIESPSPATRSDVRVPTTAYTSPRRADAERALFRRVPVPVGYTSELVEPGSFVTREIAAYPLLIARDEAGEVGVFANVCRHRGTRVHQHTIARFFVDGGVVSDRLGRNARSAGARRDLLKLDALPPEQRGVRTFATMFYFVFPGTVLVVHPDWVTHITMTPETERSSVYTHAMLVPRDHAGDDRRAHWRKTWELIEEKVFQVEDLAVADSIQSSLSASVDVDRVFRIGGLELPIRWFHDSLEEALEDG